MNAEQILTERFKKGIPIPATKKEIAGFAEWFSEQQNKELKEALMYARKNLIESGFTEDSMQIISINKLLKH